MTSTLSLSAAASFSSQQLTAHAPSNIQISPVPTRAQVLRAWQKLPCHDRTSATNNSNGNWKHFCLGLTDHSASWLSDYLHDRILLRTYLYLPTYLRRYHRQRLQIITTVWGLTNKFSNGKALKTMPPENGGENSRKSLYESQDFQPAPKKRKEVVRCICRSVCNTTWGILTGSIVDCFAACSDCKGVCINIVGLSLADESRFWVWLLQPVNVQLQDCKPVNACI